MSKVYYITGGNRGIGFEFVKAYKNEGTVIATTRNPETSTELSALAKEFPNIHVIKLDVTSQSDNLRAAEEVGKIVDKVDVFIANAGVAESYIPITKVTEDDLHKHFDTNLFGAIYSFQAIYPLLKEGAEKTAVFISTLAGSVSQFAPFITGSYGPSKAALNHVVLQLDNELKSSGFKVIAVHPGLVSTPMGNVAHKKLTDVGLVVETITPEFSVAQIVKTIEGLDKSSGAEFLNYDGTPNAW